MTRAELEQKVNSMKMPLTKDEIYELGKLNKSLDKVDWRWFANLIGWKSSSESLRGFVNNRMKKDGLLPTREEGLLTEKQELQKERVKLRDERTSLNAKIRDVARVERFLEELRTSAREISKTNPLPYYTYRGNADTSVEAVALFSDLHLGMQINEYCNKYNKEIASHRVDKWVEDVIKYCRANNVKRLNVCNLGDLISGEIHPTIRVDQEEDVASQVIHAGDLLASALNRLQEAAPEVIYRSVSDNHARFMPDLHQSIERENFFRLIDNWLEVRLENTKIQMPKDNINFRTGKFRLMNGKLCMFEHGHNLKPNASFQSLIGMVEEYVHYVFLAHYHESKAKHFQNMLVIVNGSICGTDPYADSIHKYTKPNQTLLIFDGNNVLNIGIDLDIRE